VSSDWLEQAGDRLAASVGDEPQAYALDPAEVVELLELARVAAHESGERLNAPLLCYLAGLARAGGGADVERLVEAVRRSAS
jgi:hypothetical protein